MVKININKMSRDGKIKIRKKGNSYEARKTIDLSKIYGFEVKKRISKTALTEEDAIATLKVKEQEELLTAAEQVKTKKYSSKLEYDRLENELSNSGRDFTLKVFVTKMLQEKKQQSEINLYSRRRKISPKTVTSYLGTANRQVIPIWGHLDIRKITTEQLQQYFDTLDYSEKYLKDIKLILKMTFQTAINLGIIQDNPASKIYVGNRKSNIGVEQEHLDKERQLVWLDLFEEDGRQWAYLFEAILLSGGRPEEVCAYTWNNIDIENDIIHIRKAYKDTIVYDTNLKKKYHKRELGDLKTPQSLRDVPLHPRLKKLILKIKEERIIEYKRKGKILKEDDFIFLNENNEPFVSEMLTNKMPKFIKKYNLEHMTVYGLRHSYATLCSSEGVPPEVLHILMGHSDFDTTRRYYIHISEARKQQEMLKLYNKQYTEEQLDDLMKKNKEYLEKINVLNEPILV
jgi:integrase